MASTSLSIVVKDWSSEIENPGTVDAISVDEGNLLLLWGTGVATQAALCFVSYEITTLMFEDESRSCWNGELRAETTTDMYLIISNLRPEGLARAHARGSKNIESIILPMVPRPFNYPLNVGNDICNINRIAWILRQQSARDRFIRKIFSRLEWPFIWKAFQRVSLSQSKPTIDTDHENRVSYTSGERDPAGIYSSRRSSPSWTLPDLSNSVDVLDPQFFNRAINDMKSPLGCLIHHIAGRCVVSTVA